MWAEKPMKQKKMGTLSVGDGIFGEQGGQYNFITPLPKSILDGIFGEQGEFHHTSS